MSIASAVPKFQHGFGNGESTRIFPQSLQVEGPLLTSHLHGLPLGDSAKVYSFTPSIWFRLPQNLHNSLYLEARCWQNAHINSGPVAPKTCIHTMLTCQFQVNMIPSVHYSIRFHHSKTKC